MTRCPVCEDGGTVMQAVGPRDAFGVPDGTVETPCPACAAGDLEAAHRIGRPARNTKRNDERHAA